MSCTTNDQYVAVTCQEHVTVCRHNKSGLIYKVGFNRTGSCPVSHLWISRPDGVLPICHCTNQDKEALS